MLMRFDPFRELDTLAQAARQGGTSGGVMAMDAYRDGDRFVIHLDLPGIDPDSVDLTIEKNMLTVRAQRAWQLRDGQEVLVSERPQGEFTRRLFLGEGLDGEHIEAKYHNGVLTIAVPVADQAKPRKVPVQADDGPRTLPATTTEAQQEGTSAAA